MAKTGSSPCKISADSYVLYSDEDGVDVAASAGKPAPMQRLWHHDKAKSGVWKENNLLACKARVNPYTESSFHFRKGLIMCLLTQLIEALSPGIRSQQDIDFAYLSQACDTVDLERRMREIDHRDRHASPGRAFGLNTP